MLLDSRFRGNDVNKMIGMTSWDRYVIMDNTMDGLLSILIMIFGAAAAGLIWFFFGKIGKK